ncbi:hypothetical protein OG735_00910 [Streptomyces sp. NBC_01210]|uniref:hypothetical protein n=1 Tax=Streptomyces sp. NBC_01210 TaxID=2903774 RepID=UPI002E168662|nr:hypothetical protein OG735_00910 [Streptomyces sp. NBC_01210]
MNTLDALMTAALSVRGVLAVSLVDGVTGLTYAEVGDCTVLEDGRQLSCPISLVVDNLLQAGAEGDAEDFLITSTLYYRVTIVVPSAGGELLLSAVLSRKESNLALATRELMEHARGRLS